MSKKYRIIEDLNGFYVQKLEKKTKPKHIIFGFIELGIEHYDKWSYASVHLSFGRLGWLFRKDTAFKTLEEAKEAIEKFIKYENPIIHEL